MQILPFLNSIEKITYAKGMLYFEYYCSDMTEYIVDWDVKNQNKQTV